MSDYTQIEDYSAKDALTAGDPEKVISGADIDTELAAIATAIASKANSASPTLTGTITVSGATIAGNATFSGANTHSGGDTFSGTVTMSGKSMYWAKGADIASAATLVLGSDGNMFDVTGSTGPITAITVPAGMLFMLQFDSTPTLTHHATNLNLPGAADLTMAAGDRLICIATAANQVLVLSIERAAATIGAVTATTSGTAWNVTGIPSWARKIEIYISAFSTNGTSDPIIQIGDSGGLETSGYAGATGYFSTAGQAVTGMSAGFIFGPSWGAANVSHVLATLVLQNPSTNTWVCSVSGSEASANSVSIGSGSKSLSGTLDRFTLTMTNGTDAGDAGSFSYRVYP